VIVIPGLFVGGNVIKGSVVDVRVVTGSVVGVRVVTGSVVGVPVVTGSLVGIIMTPEDVVLVVDDRDVLGKEIVSVNEGGGSDVWTRPSVIGAKVRFEENVGGAIGVFGSVVPGDVVGWRVIMVVDVGVTITMGVVVEVMVMIVVEVGVSVMAPVEVGVNVMPPVEEGVSVMPPVEVGVKVIPPVEVGVIITPGEDVGVGVGVVGGLTIRVAAGGVYAQMRGGQLGPAQGFWRRITVVVTGYHMVTVVVNVTVVGGAGGGARYEKSRYGTGPQSSRGRVCPNEC
jgi:hypothetical protein